LYSNNVAIVLLLFAAKIANDFEISQNTHKNFFRYHKKENI